MIFLKIQAFLLLIINYYSLVSIKFNTIFLPSILEILIPANKNPRHTTIRKCLLLRLSSGLYGLGWHSAHLPKLKIILLCYGLLNTFQVLCQDTVKVHNQFNKKRFRSVYIGGSSLYGITLVGLNQIWYKNNPRTSFHFFDDKAEWQQVDKAGHFFTAYHISHTGFKVFQWAGMPKRKAVWLGSITGLIFQTPIEILDGFSAAYGASWSDLLANTAGSALVLQNLFWEEPRIHPKFSFHKTAYARLRPNVLGETLPQQIIKDYNGQTYWLAFDIQPWLGKQSKFPPWLNISLGYGAEKMIFAHATDNIQNGYKTYRQYYLSLDLNLIRIPVRNKLIKSLFFALNTIHIPAPALEWNKKQGLTLHGLYF